MANPVLAAERFPRAVTRDASMTVGGTAAKSVGLLALVGVGAVGGWNSVERNPGGSYDSPGWLWLLSLLVFFLGVSTASNPRSAPVTGPLYAVGEGVLLGSLSHLYEAAWNGIVLQAVLVTFSVLAAAVVATAAGLVRPSDRRRSFIVSALGALIVLYLVAFLFALFGVEFSFLYDNSGLGIGFSLLLVGLASLSVVEDVTAIATAADAGAPRLFEWYAAWGLMVSLIWLYLEVLRLLARSQNR